MEECLVNQQIKSSTTDFWKAALALGIGGFAVFSNLHMTQPILPMLTKEIGITPTMASLTVSIATASLSLFLLFFGPISDAYGRKRVMGAGLILTGIASILVFFVHSFAALLALRALQGIALAALPAVAYAYIGEEFDPKSVGSTIGLYISCTSLGGLSGRIISGFIADYLGWRYSFLILGSLVFLLYIPFHMLLPESANFKARPLSFKVGVKELFEHWKNPVLRLDYYIAGIIFFILVGLFNYLGFRLHGEPYNLPTSVIGFLYVTYLAGTFSSTLSGKLDNRLTIIQRILIGLVLMIVGMLLTLFNTLVIIILGLIVVSFGFFFTHAASSSWVSHHAQKAKASASALYLFIYYVGGSLGSTFLGVAWEKAGWVAVISICLLAAVNGILISIKMSKTGTRKALT